MPRTQRLKISDETAVYHAWDVEPSPPAKLKSGFSQNRTRQHSGFPGTTAADLPVGEAC